ncbi:hypothetical protein IWQ60_002018 [Tieghemiomyces parasiticus]|uniref:Uncharacterized protein n=1 Tax=Tieghemiomyces parasiticus TaxID=78921 RepID=A0A9W8E212_9FUNG|nr:hypothetical protein IWQ60_002018 [Tieghemiomyces parasiticus]
MAFTSTVANPRRVQSAIPFSTDASTFWHSKSATSAFSSPSSDPSPVPVPRALSVVDLPLSDFNFDAIVAPRPKKAFAVPDLQPRVVTSPVVEHNDEACAELQAILGRSPSVTSPVISLSIRPLSFDSSYDDLADLSDESSLASDSPSPYFAASPCPSPINRTSNPAPRELTGAGYTPAFLRTLSHDTLSSAFRPRSLSVAAGASFQPQLAH